MGSIAVDQIGPDGQFTYDVDTLLSEREKTELLLRALPGATLEKYAGVRVVRYRDQVILKAQITHLGNPWPGFKKRIQIPKHWLTVHQQAVMDGLEPRFIGIYHYDGVTVFVDFDPKTYVLRKANNSAAHVATNDLFQAQTLGAFSREDRNRNQLTSVRFDEFANYLRGALEEQHPHIDVIDRFNREFLAVERLEALDVIREMHARDWPDTFQGEWAGFYLEFRIDEFLRRSGSMELIEFQKVKGHGRLDYDLILKEADHLAFYGDLKASDNAKHEAPGNDAEDIRRCVKEFGRFWYVIYGHDTWKATDNGDRATLAWNEWKRSVGYFESRGMEYKPLSYARRFKEAVRFAKMSILEVNEANLHVVLGDFHQGQQPNGASRALKVMINKKNIDNFLVFSAAVD